jgi:diguanylate cyclase (GGDEF)-like protein
VLRDSRGRLWAGTPRGLFRRDAGSERFVAVPLPPPGAGDPQAQRQPESLLEDSAGRIWVGTNRTGTFVLDADGGAARAVLETHTPPGMPPLASLRVMSMVEAQPGEVWLATLGQGIVIVDAASGHTRRVRHRSDMPASLADNTVRGLYRDRSGLLWAATHGGLSRVDPRATAVQAIAGPRGVQQARTEYVALFTHSDGRLWLGTHGDGLEIVDPRGGPGRALRPGTAGPDSTLPPDVIMSMAEADDGSVYVGTYRGLYQVRRDARGVKRLVWPVRPPGGGVGPLLRDGGTLWVAGLNDGLWQLDLASGRLRAAVSEPARTLTDSRITALARGPGGEIWIGTRNGLNRYDPATGQVLRVPAGGLAAGFVSSLLLDRTQRLWVGTYGGGMHLLAGGDAAAPLWQRFGRAEGLPDENVNAMAEDAEGRLWVSTENGLAAVDPASGRVQALRRAEGVVFLSYWTNAVTRTQAGELLFGASGGLTLLRPQALPPWTHRPPVVATDVRIGDRPVPLPADGSPLVVPADNNRIAVEYAALDFSAPERNRHEHKLEGVDADWVPTDPQRRLAAYANLAPGDYRLLLRGSNREGVFGETPLVLPLRVLPAWHQTLAFRAAALAAFALLLYAVVQLRTRTLRARRRELQRLVDERTAELQAVSLALEEKSRVLQRASSIDPLTGLHNRRFLSEHIETSLAGADTLFFLIDADHFKRINDNHGHAAGDAVLVQLARRLQAAMRDADFVVRWGGEEFLAVARDTGRERADELAERIRSSVADQPFRLDNGQALHVTCSVGHAAWPFLPAHPQAVDWLGVVNLADLGLLAAKRLGRNAWVGLHGTAGARPDGLLVRAQAAPLRLLQGGEIALTSSRPVDHAAEALAAG